MIDWDSLVLRPVAEVFGEAFDYAPSPESPIFTGGPALRVNGKFTEAYVDAAELGPPAVNSLQPIAGVHLSQFPFGYEPRYAQGDMLTRIKTGRIYVVKSGQPDGRGHARLELNLQAES